MVIHKFFGICLRNSCYHSFTATKYQETLRRSFVIIAAIVLMMAATATVAQDYGDCTPGYWNPPPFSDGSRLYNVPRWCVSVVRESIPGLAPIGSVVVFNAGHTNDPIPVGPERTITGTISAYQFAWGPEDQRELRFFVTIQDQWYYSMFPSIALRDTDFELTNP